MSASERRRKLEELVDRQAAQRVSPKLLQDADPYFDLAGEEFGRRLLLTTADDGLEYCLRPDFTLPIVADYISAGPGRPQAFSYLGPIFRQRETGPAEFEQAGLELLAQPDGDAALDGVFAFANAALEIFGVAGARITLGGVGLFEAILDQIDMPNAWRPRIRHRFGHPEALERLLVRLEGVADSPRVEQPTRDALITDITERMVDAGLSLTESRNPEEIAERYLEQQALDAAVVPAATLALLRDYLAISGPAGDALEAVETLARTRHVDVAAPLTVLRRHLAALGADVEMVFDAAFSPRLDYYTGIVFEITGRDGTVLASGGQYDRLLERLGATAPIAASGCALWVDRLEAEADQ